MPNRRDTRRRRRRRRNRGGLGALARPLSVLLAAVAIVAALTLFFKVDQVEVSGNSRYRADEVVAASGVETGDNLILFDKYTTSERIYTKLPYVIDVRINRRFPDTLLVDVTETQAVASIHGADAWWLLGVRSGKDGPELKVLEAVDSEMAQDYLAIGGLEAATPTVGKPLRVAEEGAVTAERLTELLTAMAERDMLARMESADFSDPDHLTLQYDERFQVELFYDADYDFKLNCLQEAVALMEPNEHGVIRMTMQDDNEVRFIPAAE